MRTSDESQDVLLILKDTPEYGNATFFFFLLCLSFFFFNNRVNVIIPCESVTYSLSFQSFLCFIPLDRKGCELFPHVFGLVL